MKCTGGTLVNLCVRRAQTHPVYTGEQLRLTLDGFEFVCNSKPTYLYYDLFNHGVWWLSSSSSSTVDKNKSDDTVGLLPRALVLTCCANPGSKSCDYRNVWAGMAGYHHYYIPSPLVIYCNIVKSCFCHTEGI